MAGRQTRAAGDGNQQPQYEHTDRQTPRQAQQQGLSPPYTARHSTQEQNARPGSPDELMPDGFGDIDSMFPQGPIYDTSAFPARPMLDQGHHPTSSQLFDEVLEGFLISCANELYAKATLIGLLSSYFRAEMGMGQSGGASNSNSVGNEGSDFQT
ncbi:hypothetical protein N7508_011170 [Penicillium antarcticum]|uniref:uncharacterized protein n=1 Tax=Penicillium antarcticum TaxID=416450 RepID=UPI002399F400|nr:uncharacterized protein N7508_011139 [Penicillium antarcticum]XP_058314208.1 uncharacterized protein N7508_011170 [Penicillium antarcticum]KAJ5288364.1 hypothetical protein N7508_011139 [Penicillium antarcticum]KAJ5288395.1 hypothetical protein N7508_011170 [Penicillium antarcticum]